jgi:hypothetical protein
MAREGSQHSYAAGWGYSCGDGATMKSVQHARRMEDQATCHKLHVAVLRLLARVCCKCS